MKLLFDQNLSPKLIDLFNDVFPGSSHVSLLKLDQAEDKNIWDYAKRHGFTLISKDADFGDLATLFGFPPKVIWIRHGNCTTSAVEALLKEHLDDIKTLDKSKEIGVLTLF